MSCNVVDITDYDPINMLTQNEVYLNAVQKASISVYNLGFKPLDQNTIHRRDGLLTAVVPRLDQAPFLDRVDASVHTYIRQKRKQDQTSRMRCSMDPNSDVMKNLAQFQLHHGVGGPEEDDDDRSGKHGSKDKKNAKKVLKVNPHDELRAARPTARMEKEKEEKRKKEEENKKKEAHKQKIAKRFVLMEDGEEMVYDDNGNKVPLQVYEKYKADKQKEAEKKLKREAEELAKARKEALARAYSSQKELWMKSSSRVERLRQQAITQRKEYPYWSPGVLPASTITMAKEQSVLPALLVFQKFPRTGEYDAAVHSMVPGDILITIEHCDHCHYHEDYTHHQTLQYEEMSRAVIEALKETAQRYALRFFSIVRGIDEIDALQLSRAHANTAARQLEASRTHEVLHHTSSLLTLGMGQSTLSGKANDTKNVDMKDEIAKEDRAIEQTLGKLRRSMSLRSFKVAVDDAQAIRNEAKVQVLQTHNKHRIGAFEVQVTLCINPNANQSHHRDHGHQHHDSNRPASAPTSSNHTSSNINNTVTSDDTSNIQQEQSVRDQPRQLLQHVLYSKLYHGAWPSVMKLRERLEVLLDTHGIARIVSGSTVRSSFNMSLSNKRPQSAPVSNPVLLGPLSQMQRHHDQNARKVIEQQQSLRRRNSNSKTLPLELLDPEAEMMRRAQQDSIEASAWQERELRRVTPLEDIVPPSFDNRFVEVQANPKSPTNNNSATNIINNMKRSSSNNNLRKNSNSVIAKASPSANNNKKTASSSSQATPLVSPSLQTKQPFSETNSKEPVGVASPADSKSKSAASNAQHPLSFDDFKDVSLTEDEMLLMENEILKSTRAAEKKKHDWSDHPEGEHKKEDPISEETDAQVIASSKQVSLANAPTTTSSFSSPNPIVKLKTKSVSFYGDSEKTSSHPNDPSPLIPDDVSVKAVFSPEDFSPIPKNNINKKNLPVPSNPRPTMIAKKPSLRPQPSLTNMQIGDVDSATDPPAETKEEPDSNNNSNSQSQSPLTDHFKSKGSSDMLKEALLSIQRMLSKDDDDDDGHHHYHHLDDDSRSGYHLMRSDTFADDPFFQQLENGGESMSVLRISVNMGDDHSVLLDSHEDQDFDPATAAATAANRVRGGVQVAITEVPRKS